MATATSFPCRFWCIFPAKAPHIRRHPGRPIIVVTLVDGHSISSIINHTTKKIMSYYVCNTHKNHTTNFGKILAKIFKKKDVTSRQEGADRPLPNVQKQTAPKRWRKWRLPTNTVCKITPFNCCYTHTRTHTHFMSWTFKVLFPHLHTS